MQWSDIPLKPSARVLRQFSGLWLLFFTVPAGIQWWREQTLTAAVLAVLALVGAAGLVWPAVVRPLFVAWMVIVFPVGWLVFNVCLALVFFGLLAPLGLLFRLVGRDALRLRKPQGLAEDATDSYFQNKPSAPLSQYYRTF